MVESDRDVQPMADDDFYGATLEFLTKKIAATKSEVTARLRATGLNLTAENFTLEEFDRMMSETSRMLRDAGNQRLANRFTDAWGAQKRILAACPIRFRRGPDSTLMPLSAAEQAAFDAWVEQVDEQSEHFERVQAEISAWCASDAKTEDP
jgi:hypothetical protein